MYADYTKETEEQLTVKKGDVVGLVEEDSFDVFWKVSLHILAAFLPACCKVNIGSYRLAITSTVGPEKYAISLFQVNFEGNVGLVPNKCFEPLLKGIYQVLILKY